MQRSRRCNGPDRGNSYARRARKHRMLARHGDGITCWCTHCGCELTFETLECDRVIPGTEGGSYADDNIVPSCRSCNASRQDTPIAEFHVRVGRVSISAQVKRNAA